jgi:hypothetical protein
MGSNLSYRPATLTEGFCGFPQFPLGQHITTSCHILPNMLFSNHPIMAMLKLRLLATGFSLQRPGFSPMVDRVALVTKKVALGQVSLRALWSSPANSHSTNDPYSSIIQGWYNRLT